MKCLPASARQTLAGLLCFALLGYGKGNTFNVRYNGGSVASKVSPQDWGNKLTITPQSILLEFKDKERSKLEIPSKSVTSLSYGQEAHRRVGTMIALAILVAPVALLGLLHKTRLHFIGIQYGTPEGTTGGILLQGDKSDYRALLVALQGVTGAPVSVSEKEREFIPVGVTVAVATDSRTVVPAASAASSAVTGSILVDTNPSGAEVYLDGAFFGSGPATLKVTAGKHTIIVKMAGFKDWSREISSSPGTEAHLAATLEKTN